MGDHIDLTALRRLKNMIGGNPADLAELIDDFVAALPGQVQALHDHAGNGDLGALRIAAHSCKSNARDLGATRLAHLCARLETECAAGEVTELPAQLARIAEAGEAALSGYSKLDLFRV